MPYNKVLTKLKHYAVGQLSQSVQKFWNRPSCEIIIKFPDYMEEVVAIIKKNRGKE